MTVNHPITVDLVQPGLTPRIYAMQHDANSRVILFTLTQAGTPWEAPEGAIFGLSYRKTDGTRGYYTEHIVRSDATVSVTVAPQVLTCPGTVDAALVCNAADGSRIAAFPLQIQVRPDPAAGKTDSDDYFNPSDALRYTPQDLTDAQKQQARANLGIGAAASDTWLYNGLQLPALPDWDKETYPYAVISLREPLGLYYLSVHKAIHYFEGEPLLGSTARWTYFGDKTPGTALLYTWQEGQAAWELWENDHWSVCVDQHCSSKDPALWANFNLYNEDQQLYVIATEPVRSTQGVTMQHISLSLKLRGNDVEEPVMVPLSRKESEMLSAVAKTGIPCVLNLLYDNIWLGFIPICMQMADGTHAFCQVVDTNRSILLQETEDGWVGMVGAIT